MSQKKVVCHGAMCKCQFGDVPDTLTVLSQKKNYINDSAGSQKLIATDKELGMPFQAKTFGQCKLQPTGSSFKPCIPSITKWDGAFEKTQLQANQGFPLLEDSKATCAIAGSPCVEITFHGQTAAASAQNVANADEQLMSQVLPINVKEINQPSPYDAIKVEDSNDSTEKTEDSISVQIDVKKDTFVPLGIKDYKGNTENDNIKFSITIEENPAEKMVIEILDGGKPYFKQEITDANMMSVGTHNWQWDGFDNWDNLNTEFLKNADLEAQVTVWYKGKEESDIISLKKIKYYEVDWVDVNIQRNIKEIQVTLRVNLKDGGAEGLDDWTDIPKKYITKGKLPIKKRTKNFKDLERLALDGINYHWGRNSNHFTAKNITINGTDYEVNINAINTTKNAMDDVNLIFNTNGDWLRSMNPGSVDGIISFFGQVMPERIVYNYGYIKGSKSWYWLGNNVSNVNDDFSYTSAHEIGHEILKKFSGKSFHSYKHKGSSTLSETLPTNKGGVNYPNSGEIDLMKYYNNDPYWYDFKRIVASKTDVLGLLWLGKLEVL